MEELNRKKKICSPYATGGAGFTLETRVQALFVTLMLSGGYAPCLPCWPIVKICLQGRINGFETDDAIIWVRDSKTFEERKLLCQVKKSLKIQKKNNEFEETIQRAWRDFNNSEVFKKGKDEIALISGMLGNKDFVCFQKILDFARGSENYDAFHKKIETPNYIEKGANEKLNVIFQHIEKIDKNFKNNIFLFLKHFHFIGVDLEENGVILSLLHSQISLFQNNLLPDEIWSKICYKIQDWNRTAMTITEESLKGSDLKKYFEKTANITFFNQTISESINVDHYKGQHFIALLCLVGGWEENNEKDLGILDKLFNEARSEWDAKIKEILNKPGSILSLKEGIWDVSNREEILKASGEIIFYNDVETFVKIAIVVLKDYKLNISGETGVIFQDEDKNNYSYKLRSGVAECLAILSNNSEVFKQCRTGFIDEKISECLHELMQSNEASFWARWDNLFSFLAEAAPDTFLKAIERILDFSIHIFDPKVNGYINTSGLFDALEILAWGEQYLVQVCMLFEKFSRFSFSRNTPLDILTKILLPWYPQTLAPISERKNVIVNLKRKNPSLAWDLLVRFIPSVTDVVFPTKKPRWVVKVPENWNEKFSRSDYSEQISFYSEQLIELAGDDVERLKILVLHLADLPDNAFVRLMEVLSSEKIIDADRNSNSIIWNALSDFTAKHHKNSEEKWAWKEDKLSKIDEVILKLKPADPIVECMRCFNFDVIGVSPEYQGVREEKLKALLDQQGIESIVELSEKVRNKYALGVSLKHVKSDDEVNNFLFPNFLVLQNSEIIPFLWGYLSVVENDDWIDNLDRTNWSEEQIALFLRLLPFSQKVADRIGHWLQKPELYWKYVDIRMAQDSEDVDCFVDGLIEFKRPYAAINCIYNDQLLSKHTINIDKCVTTLLKTQSSDEPAVERDSYKISKIISRLQKDHRVSKENLETIEWNNLSVLESKRYGEYNFRFLTLEKKLARDSKYFSEIVLNTFSKSLYPDQKGAKEKSVKAKDLLLAWQVPPGMLEGGEFSGEEFRIWFSEVDKLLKVPAHKSAAYWWIGAVLAKYPKDKAVLWIDEKVVKVLDDHKEIREGFKFATINDGEVHTFEGGIPEEKAMSEDYKEKSKEMKEKGYCEFSRTLSEISEYYDGFAEHIMNRYS
jgi:hypothetical protein